MRRPVFFLVAALGFLFLVGSGPASAATDTPATNISRIKNIIITPAVFRAWNAERPPRAVTYDPGMVPVGAAVGVLASRGPRTVVGLAVHGLAPTHTFGAHVHQKACGASGADAGPHYQNVSDPTQPSVDPTFANPRNEVWLDLTTDAAGSAVAFAVVNWDFRPGGAHSVVIHEHATASAAGQAGMAGDRLACVNVPLSDG
ncbi:Superoxide dismutase [Frankia canadensis]|uniref:Superoxide dismutase n=1 Tax=Frankia canadensis TaxID=1836972 RepID=A0A2I2KYD6_9ACTN|nr:superoxide dismutase family protein [Frankia canadensis]SNQ50675.1 Superoxide dismutase [Frankia canadensis]SOU57965.1 Superoxide dismutase [Frankia canadensis]